MKKCHMAIIFLLIYGLGPHSAAALECNALLTHGLRNIQISQGTDAASKFLYTNHCHKNFEHLDDSVFAEAEVEIFGYGGGGASFSRNQREERLTEWCKSHKEEARTSNASYTESRIIYDKALQAWESCNALSSRGILAKVQIAADNTLVNVNLRYTGAGASGIQFLGVNQQENFECKVTGPRTDGEGVVDYSPAYIASNDVFISAVAIVVNCFRSPEKEEREVDGVTYQVSPLAAIGIDTAQESFSLDFPESWPPPGAPTAQFEALRLKIEDVNSTSRRRVNSLQTKLVTGAIQVHSAAIATNAKSLVNARLGCEWFPIKTHEAIVCPATQYVAGVCLTNKGDGCPGGQGAGVDGTWHVAGGIYCCNLQ